MDHIAWRRLMAVTPSGAPTKTTAKIHGGTLNLVWHSSTILDTSFALAHEAHDVIIHLGHGIVTPDLFDHLIDLRNRLWDTTFSQFSVDFLPDLFDGIQVWRVCGSVANPRNLVLFQPCERNLAGVRTRMLNRLATFEYSYLSAAMTRAWARAENLPGSSFLTYFVGREDFVLEGDEEVVAMKKKITNKVFYEGEIGLHPGDEQWTKI